MTTLLLLLSVIRYHASLNPDEAALASEIADTCLTNLHVADPDERHKVRPTLRDRGTFQQALDGGIPETSSQIGKAWAYFSKMIEARDHAGDPFKLRQLKERATYYLDVVSIKLKTGDSPNRIFESLNNTGVRLDASDLIGTFVFMLISDEEQQSWTYERIWFPMQEELGDSIDDFFWRYSMKDGALTRWDDIFDDAKASLEELPEEEIIPALETYAKFSRHYLKLRTPQKWETNQEIADQLNNLNDWEVDVCYPFLLSLFDLRESGDVSTTEVVEVLNMVESFIVRREIGWKKRTPKSDKIERRRCQYERCPSRKIHEGIPPGSSEAGNGREAIIAGGSPPVVPGAIDVRVLGEGTKGRQTGRCRQDVQALDRSRDGFGPD